MVFENPYVPGLFHESSNNIEDWPICYSCMIEHCCGTDCNGCKYGNYPDCRFLWMKRYYMNEE